ncbi:MAG: SpoIIE family protein phosphatase [Spirochaetaceae bacterium]|nr:SpoIIE family protein phosphatase [Spirochaetaceae bacterium]
MALKEEKHLSYLTILAAGMGVLFLGGAAGLLTGNIMLFSAAVLLESLAAAAAGFIRLQEKNADRTDTLDDRGSFSADFPEPEGDTFSGEEESAESRLVTISRDFVIQAVDTISEEIGLDRLLDYINRSMIEKTGADGGVIFLVDDFEDIITVKSFYGDFPPPYKLPEDLPHKPLRVETNFRYAQFNLGDTIFGEVASSGHGELIVSGAECDRIFQNGPEEFLRCGSYILFPMIVRDTVIGVVAVSRKPDTPPFSQEDFEMARILTDFASAVIKMVYAFQEAAEHTDIIKEADVAWKIQKRLFPHQIPVLPEVSFGNYFTSAIGICGDYYDIIPVRRDRIMLAVADVAGKGINSVIVMIMIRAILQLVVNSTKDAATIIDWLNRGITSKINTDHYATLSLVNYNSIDKTIEYAAAGNNSLLIWRQKEGEVEQISIKSDPIGLERTTLYTQKNISVEIGDIVVLYTDGIIEAINQSGEPYSMERLKEGIMQYSELTAKEIANKVGKDIEEFKGSAHQHDDQTLLVMKIQG